MGKEKSGTINRCLIYFYLKLSWDIIKFFILLPKPASCFISLFLLKAIFKFQAYCLVSLLTASSCSPVPECVCVNVQTHM